MTSEKGQPDNDAAQAAALAANITEGDLYSFYQAHFGDQPVGHFDHEFLRPQDHSSDAYDGAADFWEDDDDLGYYEDGVKRTLTDEQIAIFRHSELQEMERKLEMQETMGDGKSADIDGDGSAPLSGQNASTSASGCRVTKKKKKKGKGRLPPEPKPDLRKRTWDVVDKGLDSLDYD